MAQIALSIRVVFGALQLEWVIDDHARASEQENQKDNDLVDGVAKDVSGHDIGYDGVVLLVWFSLENSSGWFLGGEGESGKRVHDQVNPEHLNGIQRSLLGHNSAQENDEHSNVVDGELELDEFSHVVIDVSSVSESDDNGGEVVIKKNDIGNQLGDISSRDTHGEADVGLSQSWRVIGTITSYGNDTSAILNTCDQNELVFRGGSRQNLQLCLNFSKFLHVSDNLNSLTIL